MPHPQTETTNHTETKLVSLEQLTIDMNCSLADVLRHFRIDFAMLMRLNGEEAKAQDLDDNIDSFEDNSIENLLNMYALLPRELFIDLNAPLEPHTQPQDPAVLVLPSREKHPEHYLIKPLTEDFLFLAHELDSQLFPHNPTTLDFMCSQYDSRFSFLAVHIATEEPQGYLIAHPVYDTDDDSEASIHISFIGVTAPRQGIGTLLFNQLCSSISQPSDIDFTQISLHVQPRNRVAIAFYQKLGFQQAGMSDQQCLMVKPISPEPQALLTYPGTFFAADSDDDESRMRAIAQTVPTLSTELNIEI
ncbi:MAG: GNAT family N-acetyltransferase [Gammaproteobacteria bacterium]|nr:GNAT family N-acetyltransferase [Gammaproteobacteria bacterium]